MNNRLEELLPLLSGEGAVYIQSHDFPDPDAVAAAFGLQYILKVKGIAAAIVYEGELQTNPLERMVVELGITMHRVSAVRFYDQDKVIIVDGGKGNKNVAGQTLNVVAVIDHHQGNSPEGVPFFDVRPEYGACSTIIAGYAQEQEICLPANVATALAIGIQVDTNSFRRAAHPEDLKAFSYVFGIMDRVMAGSILRNNIFQADLVVYRQAIENIRIRDRFAFCFLPGESSQNFLGIMADFFLSVDEVNFVVMCARRGDEIIFSVRSEHPDWNAALVIREALSGKGSGGGHRDMAGGLVKDAAAFDAEEIYRRFCALLQIRL